MSRDVLGRPVAVRTMGEHVLAPSRTAGMGWFATMRPPGSNARGDGWPVGKLAR